MKNLQRFSAVIMITAGLGFATIAVMGIWGVFEDDDIAWRSLGTLAVIAFASLVINVGARIYDQSGRR